MEAERHWDKGRKKVQREGNDAVCDLILSAFKL